MLFAADITRLLHRLSLPALAFWLALAHAAAEPATVAVPAGEFLMGSTRAERAAAYLLDERAYGDHATREQGWYENEPVLHKARTGAFRVMVAPVGNAQYAEFVAATGHRAPDVGQEEWAAAGLIHPYTATRRFAWQARQPPIGRENHPIVLVSRDDAQAYAEWLSAQTGRNWRLPTEAEWEKAARSTDGRMFPWGRRWDAHRLNSADAGPFDTLPVGSIKSGASPYGMLDAAGQVYEWTATEVDAGHAIVKGGSWDDRGCGVCRPAARHARPVALRHILIGFRLLRAP